MENQDGDNNYSNEEENGNKQNGYDIEIEKEEYSTKQGKNGNNKKIKEKIIKKRTDKKTTASIGLFYCRKVAKEQAKWYD